MNIKGFWKSKGFWGGAPLMAISVLVFFGVVTPNDAAALAAGFDLMTPEEAAEVNMAGGERVASALTFMFSGLGLWGRIDAKTRLAFSAKAAPLSIVAAVFVAGCSTLAPPEPRPNLTPGQVGKYEALRLCLPYASALSGIVQRKQAGALSLNHSEIASRVRASVGSYCVEPEPQGALPDVAVAALERFLMLSVVGGGLDGDGEVAPQAKRQRAAMAALDILRAGRVAVVRARLGRMTGSEIVALWEQNRAALMTTDAAYLIAFDVPPD